METKKTSKMERVELMRFPMAVKQMMLHPDRLMLQFLREHLANHIYHAMTDRSAIISAARYDVHQYQVLVRLCFDEEFRRRECEIIPVPMVQNADHMVMAERYFYLLTFELILYPEVCNSSAEKFDITPHGSLEEFLEGIKLMDPKYGGGVLSRSEGSTSRRGRPETKNYCNSHYTTFNKFNKVDEKYADEQEAYSKHRTKLLQKIMEHVEKAKRECRQIPNAIRDFYMDQSPVQLSKQVWMEEMKMHKKKLKAEEGIIEEETELPIGTSATQVVNSAPSKQFQSEDPEIQFAEAAVRANAMRDPPLIFDYPKSFSQQHLGIPPAREIIENSLGDPEDPEKKIDSSMDELASLRSIEALINQTINNLDNQPYLQKVQRLIDREDRYPDSPPSITEKHETEGKPPPHSWSPETTIGSNNTILFRKANSSTIQLPPGLPPPDSFPCHEESSLKKKRVPEIQLKEVAIDITKRKESQQKNASKIINEQKKNAKEKKLHQKISTVPVAVELICLSSGTNNFDTPEEAPTPGQLAISFETKYQKEIADCRDLLSRVLAQQEGFEPKKLEELLGKLKKHKEKMVLDPSPGSEALKGQKTEALKEKCSVENKQHSIQTAIPSMHRKKKSKKKSILTKTSTRSEASDPLVPTFSETSNTRNIINIIVKAKGESSEKFIARVLQSLKEDSFAIIDIDAALGLQPILPSFNDQFHNLENSKILSGRIANRKNFVETSIIIQAPKHAIITKIPVSGTNYKVNAQYERTKVESNENKSILCALEISSIPSIMYAARYMMVMTRWSTINLNPLLSAYFKKQTLLIHWKRSDRGWKTYRDLLKGKYKNISFNSDIPVHDGLKRNCPNLIPHLWKIQKTYETDPEIMNGKMGLLLLKIFRTFKGGVMLKCQVDQLVGPLVDLHNFERSFIYALINSGTIYVSSPNLRKLMIDLRQFLSSENGGVLVKLAGGLKPFTPSNDHYQKHLKTLHTEYNAYKVISHGRLDKDCIILKENTKENPSTLDILKLIGSNDVMPTSIDLDLAWVKCNLSYPKKNSDKHLTFYVELLNKQRKENESQIDFLTVKQLVHLLAPYVVFTSASKAFVSAGHRVQDKKESVDYKIFVKQK